MKQPTIHEKNTIDLIKNWMVSQDPNCAPKATYEPNGQNTSPDYLLEMRDRKIFIEIRDSGKGDGFDKTGRAIPREKQEEGLNKLEQIIREDIKPILSSEETIILIINNQIPEKGRVKIAAMMASEIKNLYRNNQFVPETKKSISIPIRENTVRFEVILTDAYRNTQKPQPLISILAGNLSTPHQIPSSDLLFQSEGILRNAIHVKSKKTKHLHGELWLAIYNTPPLLKVDAYQEAMNQITSSGLACCFSKVLIIDEGQVTEIFQQSF